MPDLRLQLTPTTVIRGAAAPAQSTHVFAVYDCIDLVGHPPDRYNRDRNRKLKRGAFSRDFWARLIRVPSGRPKTELESLASLAPIRASVTLNRMVHVPVMTVPGLLKLIDCVMRDLQKRTTISDYHKEHVTSVICTLARFQAGDSSMLQVLPEPVPEIDAADVAPARARKKRKTVSAATATTATDVNLRLKHDKDVFGTVHPVHEHVFSAYAFLDLIGRHLHPASNCKHFARRFWANKISKDPYLRSVAVMAHIRCSASFAMKTNTPALHVQGLRHLIRLMLHHPTEYKGKWQNKIYIPVDRETVDPIGKILDAYIAGDRSMIERITAVQ